MARVFQSPYANAAIAALALASLVACGGGEASSPASSPAPEDTRPDDATPETPPASAIPDMPVLEVPSGEEFALASLAPSDRPVLLWFWAPN